MQAPWVSESNRRRTGEKRSSESCARLKAARIRYYSSDRFRDRRISTLLDNIDVTDDGCWNWLGKVDKDGYPKYRGKAAYVMLNYFREPRPNGAHALHKCRSKACINPAHLY